MDLFIDFKSLLFQNIQVPFTEEIYREIYQFDQQAIQRSDLLNTSKELSQVTFMVSMNALSLLFTSRAAAKSNSTVGSPPPPS